MGGMLKDTLETEKADAEEMRQKIARVDTIHVHGFEDVSDDDLKRMRFEEKYAIVPRY